MRGEGEGRGRIEKREGESRVERKGVGQRWSEGEIWKEQVTEERTDGGREREIYIKRKRACEKVRGRETVHFDLFQVIVASDNLHVVFLFLG